MIGQAFEERGCYAEKEARPEQPLRGSYARVAEPLESPRCGIGGELQTLRELTNAAHEYVTMLEQKTSAFRRIYPQCEAKENKGTRLQGSELTEELCAQNARLQTLCTRLSTIIEEIDL